MNVFILKAQYICQENWQQQIKHLFAQWALEKGKDGHINQKGNQQFVPHKYFDKIDSIYAISADLIYMLY